jgi:DNA-binding beta-propeller fold protein YncE
MHSSAIRFQRLALVGLAGVGLAIHLVNCGGGNTMPMKSEGVTKITVTAAASGLDTPLDATPDPLGKEIYYIATGTGGPGIFHVSAAGGTPNQVFMGAPLVDPHGISISSDGKTLYVADRTGGANMGGVIFSLPTAGDTPVPVAGSEGTHPSALDLAEVGSSDDIYFTGEDTNGDPAIFKLAAAGGTAEVLAKGAPLAKPDGITVATDKTVYVADKQAGMAEPGQVFKLVSGKATTFGPELTPGDPTGIAVTLDDAKLLVSALDPATGTSEVDIIEVKNASASTFNDVIKSNTFSGGLHRARFKDVYAWAGKTIVYKIGITKILADSSTPGGVGVN